MCGTRRRRLARSIAVGDGLQEMRLVAPVDGVDGLEHEASAPAPGLHRRRQTLFGGNGVARPFQSITISAHRSQPVNSSDSAIASQT
jgi:hypothetical protein